ncbi:MAG: hypothetical protein RJA09_1510 [Pseudomonadota bacterium]
MTTPRFWCIPLLATVMAACSGMDKTPQKITLAFDAAINGQAFRCGDSYTGVGTTKSTITPTDFRFYVSQVELQNQQGLWVPLTLDEDGKWQKGSVALLDFENGLAPCRNGTAATNTTVRGELPAGRYTGLRFTLGVPFEQNHGDPTTAPAPLNTTAMFWNWQGGYKFLRFDATSNGLKPGAGEGNTGYNIHLGSTQCAAASRTAAPTACQNSNRVAVLLQGFDPHKSRVVADVGPLMASANVDTNAPKTSPGCMAFPGDSDCVPVMDALGLPYGDRTAPGPQRLFSLR